MPLLSSALRERQSSASECWESLSSPAPEGADSKCESRGEGRPRAQSPLVSPELRLNYRSAKNVKNGGRHVWLMPNARAEVTILFTTCV